MEGSHLEELVDNLCHTQHISIAFKYSNKTRRSSFDCFADVKNQYWKLKCLACKKKNSLVSVNETENFTGWYLQVS